MILRDVHVENWCCIRELDLGDLPEGIVVLHGPNRTGKSSLVLALRSCLFDCEHDSNNKEIKRSLPWNGSGPPKVVVTFTTGGQEYRLTKVFSKKKDGTALLEKKVGALWRVEQSAPKEASRRARELLGASSSNAGLNQLLWLSQGEVGLPNQKDLDDNLQRQLSKVLGDMVTGRDFDFKNELNERYARWFTPGGKYKEASLIGQWEKLKEERLRTWNDEQRKLHLWEDGLRRLEECEAELPVQKRSVDIACKEAEALRAEHERSKDRRQLYNSAVAARETAASILKQAEDVQAKHRAAQERVVDLERALTSAREAEEAARALRSQLDTAHKEQVRQVTEAIEAERLHQPIRDSIDDCRKLLTIAQRLQQIENELGTVDTVAMRIGELEVQLKDATAPDEKTLDGLRKTQRQMASMRAQLEAAALRMAVTLDDPSRLTIALDGQAAQAVDLLPGEKRTWSPRQRADIVLEGVGTIELGRMQQDLDLEQCARDLDRQRREFEDAVRSYEENPADDACLDRLAERRVQRNSWTNQLKELRKELHKLAPEGRSALEADRITSTNQRRLVLERRPHLADWNGTMADVDESEKEFKLRAAELEQTRKRHEANAPATLTLLQNAETDLQAKKLTVAAADASLQAGRDELKRMGDEADVLSKLGQARNDLAIAEEAVAKNKLSEAEETIEGRCAEAESALGERKRRLSELQEQLIGLRGFLQGNEGLHARVTDAESSMNEAEAALAREKREADAHKRLRELFDECRETKVQAVMGPIASRVLDWSRKIGLCEYEEVRFGDRFLPEGIVMGSAAEQAVPFEDESYGTAEQLSLFVRLALGGILAKDEPVVAILDDPLAHADAAKHRSILNVLRLAAEGNPAWTPAAGRLQIIILTCHPDRFDHLPGARHIDLARMMKR